ncbi:MAG: hypothetical protein ACLPSF_14550 [Methylocella sp.]
MIKAEFGRIFMGPRHEAPLSYFSKDADADAIEWVERYIKLSSAVLPKCDIAIERLNLARRRTSPGNKAIEGAICLEALLGDNLTQELAYRLKLRTALFLATEINERREIAQGVSSFYDLRSKTVHGVENKQKDAQKHEACAKRGLELCARVLRAIVSLNKTFVPEDLELGGLPRREG